MTAKLGDLFPLVAREKHARSLLTRGAVLRLFSKDINNRKVKRLIVIGFAENDTLGKVFINSNPQSTHSQIRLDSSNRNYLEHDSYVDCSRIYEDNSKELLEMVKGDLDCHIGQVSDEDMKSIESALKAAQTISPKVERRYGLDK